MSSMWLRLRRSALDLYRDRRGVAAVEFAIIIPVMLVMFFGTADFSSGIAVNRKVTLMARTLSDLTSQSVSVSDADLTNFFAASTGILTPYSTTPMTTSRITELYVDPTVGAKVIWSKGTAPYAPGTLIPVPTGLIGKDPVTNTILPNQYLILSEVSYLYTPMVNYVMKSAITLSDHAYTRPRQSTCVIYPTPTSGLLPSCPTS